MSPTDDYDSPWKDVVITELERERDMPYINSFERVGLERGLREGREEGRKEGLQKMLSRQLEERFSPLPDPVRERIAKANSSQLEAWGIALVVAPSLQTVFVEP